MRDALSRVLLLFAILSLVGCASPSPGTAAKDVRSEIERIAAPEAADADVDELVQGNRAFALDLYRYLREHEGGNLFYSPHSISLALAMTYTGARGETARQMANTLHFTLPPDRLHPAVNSLDQILARRGEGAAGRDDQGFRLNVVNAIWGQAGYTFLDDFLDTLAAYYGAGMRLLDYAADAEAARATINDWVSEQTEERIEELLAPGAVDASTRLVLTNAIYFSAAWANPFMEGATVDGTFHGHSGDTTVPMMRQVSNMRYIRGEGYQAVALPYDGHELAMTILLPDAGAFDAFEADLDAARVEEILSEMQFERVALSMPRFELDTNLGLAKALTALGMIDAFGENADFSGMTGSPDLYISDVVHRAFVAVDEAGTEAAAATAVIMPESAPIDEPIEVSVDRPFILLIHDIETGAILFMGRIVDLS
ncbi:MAG: serpin family protein [Anaerolineae bacterium]|jgi:serpin B